MTTGCIARFLCLGGVIAVCGHASLFSNCDVTQDGTTKVADVQKLVNQALGDEAAANDLNADSVVNVVDVQIGVDAVLGLGCAADPHLISIVPNTGQQGTNGINVTISSAVTSFSNSSTIDLGAGITVTNIAATNATTLTATLSIAANAATGARDLTVDGLTLPGAFTVTLPVSVSYTYDSQGRLATATYSSPTGSTTVVTYTYDAAGNRTAVVAQ